MVNLTECTTHWDYENHPELNGWYLLDNKDYNHLLKMDMLPVKEVTRMAAVMADKAGECDEQLRDFSEIKFDDAPEICVLGVATEEEDDFTAVAVGVEDVEYVFTLIVKKSKLDRIKSEILFGSSLGLVNVSEVPGIAAMIFLQSFAKYLIGELEPMEWVDPT